MERGGVSVIVWQILEKLLGFSGCFSAPKSSSGFLVRV